MSLAMDRQIRAAGVWCALTICIAGCTGQMSPQKIADAGQALETAKVEASGGNWDAAVKNFDAALAGGLNADQYAEAYLGRAVARANTGNFDGALEDISKAERGPPAPEDIHALRGYVLQKGDKAGADREFAEAKKLNPRVRIPTDAPGAGS